MLCAAFSTNSDLVVTGSLDSTVRIWSSRRGEPLFQINIPDPVTCIKLDYHDRLYCNCANRMLIFKIKPLFKEADLPNYWQHGEIAKNLTFVGKSRERDQINEERKDVMITFSWYTSIRAKKINCTWCCLARYHSRYSDGKF